ncbi:MAG: hypothetical protein A2V85_12490 [Chloroflexi bacterium RBG_16_72_14]|nr:MAG: hypothetical protein A2V85_12490 [Chloroflexi bacterium RBG_16_72_14]
MPVPDADDLAAIERDRLRALVERDMDRAAELHADDFELITPSGRRLSKAEYLAAVRTRDIDYWSWEAGEIELREHGDVAAVRYPAEMTFRGPDGPRLHTMHTDLYERRDGRWQVVWSQATEIRD